MTLRNYFVDIVTLNADLQKTNYGSEIEIMNYILKTAEFMSENNLVTFNKILKYIYINNINYKKYIFLSQRML